MESASPIAKLQTEIAILMNQVASTSFQTRLQGISGLRNLSAQDGTRTTMINTLGLVNALLKAAQQGETSAMKQNALGGLANLANSKENKTSLFQSKGVVETMLNAAQQGETLEIKQAGLNGLANIAIAKDNKIRLFETKGVVEAMLSAAQQGETSGIKEKGLRGLVNLTTADENQTRLFVTKGVVEALLRAAQEGETTDIQKQGLRGLANLAFANENQIRLFETNGVVKVMLRAAQEGETFDMKVYGLSGLVSLAWKRENAIRLFEIKGVVEVMLRAAQQGETYGIKEQGLMGLVNLAIAKENQIRLFETKGVVETIFRAAQSDESDNIILHGLRCIWNLSDNVQLADRLVVDHNLISLLHETTFKEDFIVSCIYLNLAVAPHARKILKQDRLAIKRIKRLEQSQRDFSRAINTLALAILRGSEDGSIGQMQTYKTQFKTILDVLKGAITGTVVLDNNWPLIQPLLALRYLTTVESNRTGLGTEWLSSLPSAIQTGLDLKDASIVESAMRCLSQYALDASTLPVLKANAAKYASIAELVIKNTSDADEEWIGAKNSAQSLLFTLNGQVEVEAQREIKVNSKQVMISYAWGPPPHENQKLATQVEAYLKACGLLVWRDVAKMKQDIMVGMVEAVQSSSAILVLVTKSYMESDNCKCELQLARRLKKTTIPLLAQPKYDHTVDGWLGAAIGSLLYYDISSLVNRESILEKMVKTELTSMISVAAMPTLMQQPFKKAKRTLNDADDVRKWAAEVQLPQKVVDALVTGGFVEYDLLDLLSQESPSELVKLLSLSLPAHGVKLRAELKKLFGG